MKAGWILFLCVVCAGAWATADYQARVIAVHDGNTMIVSTEAGEEIEIVLFGIDCPELEQRFGLEAKNFLEDRVLSKEVVVTELGKDRRGKRLALVQVKGKKDLRQELLEKGLAWASEKNADQELVDFQTKAREKGRGLWSDADPTPPWIFRRQQTMLQPKSS